MTTPPPSRDTPANHQPLASTLPASLIDSPAAALSEHILARLHPTTAEPCPQGLTNEATG